MTYKIPAPSSKENNDSKNLKEIDLMANVSHEIRNPVNAILGLSRLLQDEVSPEDRKEYIEGLVQSAENLLEIVNNLMDFSKLNSGKLQFYKKPGNLAEIIPRSLYGQKLVAEAKGLELNYSIDSRLPEMLMLDSVKIMQVLVNLVSNAIKFTEEGAVSVFAELAGSIENEVHVIFRVLDTGIGIPTDKLESIFKAFRQGGADTNLKYGGTGLGLSISKTLVQLMGGQFEVSSEIGKGSEFKFGLAFKTSNASALVSHKEQQVKCVKGLRVLVVDDNKFNRLVVRKNLENWQAYCILAENGKEALEKVQEQEIDLIFMDLQMPVMDGWAATQHIRSLDSQKFRNLPIIALSGSTPDLSREELAEKGFTTYLNKPFRPEELLQKLIKFGRNKKPDSFSSTDLKAC